MSWLEPKDDMPRAYQLVILNIYVPFAGSDHTKLVRGCWDPVTCQWFLEDGKTYLKQNRVCTWKEIP